MTGDLNAEFCRHSLLCRDHLTLKGVVSSRLAQLISEKVCQSVKAN